MQDTHDPFTPLLNELRAHDAGHRTWPPGLRRLLVDQLRTQEAQELAWGYRHLTVIHGEILNATEARALDHITHTLHDHTDGRWHRIGTIADHHLTLTIAGPDADTALTAVAEHLRRHAPSHWTITPTAVVEAAP